MRWMRRRERSRERCAERSGRTAGAAGALGAATLLPAAASAEPAVLAAGPGASVVVPHVPLDLSSFASVRAFAGHLLQLLTRCTSRADPAVPALSTELLLEVKTIMQLT